jgi:hypothetical protein
MRKRKSRLAGKRFPDHGETGANMMANCKETCQGGLAVNVIEC